MKILTVLGTRPEIIRLSLIIPKLDEYASRHILVHTGQNFTESLSGQFFKELGLRTPDYVLQDKAASLGRQLSAMFEQLESILVTEKPDKILLLGDTNSALSAILAERMGIPVVHMEAGNRCFDLDVPEEKNRRVIDAISTINMPYTEQSKHHLIREGVSSQRIVLTGNPIYEVMKHYEAQTTASDIMTKLGLKSGQYFLVTAHRAENVDVPHNLEQIMEGLNKVAAVHGQRIICSIHPRTRARIKEHLKLEMHPLVEFYEPFGFFDFLMLEMNARCALTDSGTVQEECCIMGIPTVTMRKTTERPETVDCGSNIVSGIDADRISESVTLMVELKSNWECPKGYLVQDVSDKVVKFLLGGKLHV
ncbi:UDP-N-acetylglucosamine 2-epimerase (non-hydrolyzing) [Paenibacillus urinalis]|uniref:UDP-N-acetylglucosamine 2-epimerase (Non-hydrolyzing) n=1 Tax=Paenibacillus urinalis TaxID=521520 RepID=A0ABY7X715_9BACL|nr:MULTISPECIES: UDP-N-acetylglucosamine 2-epimerase (non-hydrolyzing) [Paenibacillus]WDH97929.1 UDP-N-acetylglucosamine 2-epimerase (non-hydrolyzing) [Paenibacillus urinalis]WDI01608.1 UDP-N-acetylglucosamine 2-epimerase (non-hydrolyzing) [Paenibacillus urinalis]GAK42594.1 UDP-N-acetylglucosamine 2-epimerase [Paenibacillus sp. TCA20]